LLFATADSTLLAPYGLDAGGLASVFGHIMSHSVDYADLYFQYSALRGLEPGRGHGSSPGSFNIDQGVGVRAVSGEKTAFAYSDDISVAALESAAYATRAIARRRRGHYPGGERTQGRELYLPQETAGSLPDRDKVKLLEQLERHARELDSRVVQVMATLAGEYEVILVARSDGVLAADVRPLNAPVAAA